MRRIAIIGGGIAGLTAACELACLAAAGAQIEAVLFESSNRFGGLIETVREGGFTVEAGPDGWVSAKPWAAELATELGLAGELISSNDATRRTHIFLTTPAHPSGRLVPMPDGLNMVVPTNLDALAGSPLFTESAIAAYRAEPSHAALLLAAAPENDESVADFTLRHFGREVLDRVAAPLLSGIFGGDVRRLSVRAVLPAFVQMERTHGSLIAALQASQTATGNLQPATFTTLRSGLGTLIDRLVAAIPPHWLRLHTTVTAIARNSGRTPTAERRKLDLKNSSSELPHWIVHTSATGKQVASETFDAVFLATPLDVTRRLLAPVGADAAHLLPRESSSAVLVAFAYADASRVPLPPGFGFLVPPRFSEPGPALDPSASLLLACTFVDQKFPHRVPPNGRLVRAFFGGAAADRIARCSNDEIAAIARLELARILNTTVPISAAAPIPAPPPLLTVIRRWPNSLPQYAVGHLDRIAELEFRLRALPGLTLLGNALHGVGIPDLIRDAKQAARAQLTTDN
ncbi:MAG: protoporphyrinogen oxidase [Acidobacteriaceae bacterium]|jgi:oxygen-dependent protoporphyrinogen oxidase